MVCFTEQSIRSRKIGSAKENAIDTGGVQNGIKIFQAGFGFDLNQEAHLFVGAMRIVADPSPAGGTCQCAADTKNAMRRTGNGISEARKQ